MYRSIINVTDYVNDNISTLWNALTWDNVLPSTICPSSTSNFQIFEVRELVVIIWKENIYRTKQVKYGDSHIVTDKVESNHVKCFRVYFMKHNFHTNQFIWDNNHIRIKLSSVIVISTTLVFLVFILTFKDHTE